MMDPYAYALTMLTGVVIGGLLGFVAGQFTASRAKNVADSRFADLLQMLDEARNVDYRNDAERQAALVVQTEYSVRHMLKILSERFDTA